MPHDTLTPLETLYEKWDADGPPLPPELASLYGRLHFPLVPGRPYVISNFVSTLDGVVALNEPGLADGGDISGHNRHDRFVMGLLRAVADAVIVGAGTQRSVPRHRWTAQHVYPALADVYRELRRSLGKVEAPLNVIVSAQGKLNLSLPIFQAGEVDVLIVTTERGLQRLARHAVPASASVRIDVLSENDTLFAEKSAAARSNALSAQAVLAAVSRARQCDLVLLEGGPQLLGDFFAARLLDEQFLTLAPQVAGRGDGERPGFVAGQRFAPDDPVWGELVSVKRAQSHLFLRYAFARRPADVTE